MSKSLLSVFGVIILSLQILKAQPESNARPNSAPGWLALAPLGDIFILQYGREFNAHSDLIIGTSYTNPAILNMIKYPGSEQILTIELGYRRYLWRKLHIELQIDPQYFLCRDTVLQKSYRGLGLTPELRFGYRFDFKWKDRLVFLNLQWFAGYHLINPKPPSFRAVDGGSSYFSPIPMFFLGLSL